MGVKALFDSDVLIDFLLGVPQAKAELARYSIRLISVVSWAEVMIGAQTKEEQRQCREFLSSFSIVNFDQAVAEEAVQLRKANRIKLPDAIVWASARVSGALFVSRNSKDFPADDPFVRFPYQV